MAKALAHRQELALIALQEIRSFPGAEHVATVEVDRQVDTIAKTNWTLHVFTREGGDMERIQFAISTTRKRLRHRHDPRPDASRPTRRRRSLVPTAIVADNLLSTCKKR